MKTIFSGKKKKRNPYRKGHPDPIFTMSALNPSSFPKSLKISVTLLKRKKKKGWEEKIYAYNLTIAEMEVGLWVTLYCRNHMIS